jgi:hypothetical protein
VARAFSQNEGALKYVTIADNHIGDRTAALWASLNKNGAARVLQGFCLQKEYRPATVKYLHEHEEA